MMSGWAVVFMLAGILLAVATAVAVWANGKSENTGRDAAARFAAALVHDDPGAAPPGAGDYVRGVRAYFGPVKSARMIGAHTKLINGLNRHESRQLSVAELLLDTERGPAVIELEFTFLSDRVNSIHELHPHAGPGLTGRERERLASAFAARGGKPADQTTLSESGARTQHSTPPARRESPPTANGTTLPARAEKILRCVRRAGGDQARLQLCAPSQPGRASASAR
jgi:hypothetical protein